MLLETVFCLAVNLYYEARSEPLDAQIAINNVVLNRISDNRFPDSACEVIKQPNQFSWYWQGRTYFPLKETKSWVNAVNIASLMTQYEYIDNTKGSIFYHVKTDECTHSGTVIGSHIFSKDYHGH